MGPVVKVDVNLEGVSKVAVKFGEIISQAVGGLCRPWQIKRVGSAEAEVESLKALTRAKTGIEITELQRRALDRFIGEESQKQTNMEQIAEQALAQITDKARPEEVSKDWIVHFFDRCRLTSDEEMQLLWARVLAGEAEQPNSFSKRTLDVLATLERFDAQNFEFLCRLVWRMKHLPIPLLYGFEGSSLKAAGLTFGRLQHLSELGLISLREAFAFTQQWNPPQQVVSYFGRHVEVTLLKEDDTPAMNVGQVMFTRVGMDLASICSVKALEGYFEEIISTWKNTYRYRVQEVPASLSTDAGASSRDDVSTKPQKAPTAVWG